MRMIQIYQVWSLHVLASQTLRHKISLFVFMTSPLWVAVGLLCSVIFIVLSIHYIGKTFCCVHSIDIFCVDIVLSIYLVIFSR